MDNKKVVLFLLAVLLPHLLMAVTIVNDKGTTIVNGIEYSLLSVLKHNGIDGTTYRFATVNNIDGKYFGETLVIPNDIVYEGESYSVTSISGGVTNGDKIQSLTISASLEFFGYYIPNSDSYGIVLTPGNPFASCPNLSSITVEDGNKTYDSRDNCNAIIETSSNTIVAGCKNSSIPSSVTAIGERAFSGCSWLESFVIPDGITTIGVRAFAGCDNLKRIEIGSTINGIGPEAFYGLANLKEFVCHIKQPIQSHGTGWFNYDAQATICAVLLVPNESVISYKETEPWNLFDEITDIENEYEHTLRYFVDNELYRRINYKYNCEITPETEPEKEGYTFSGWSEIPTVMPGKDVNVYGTFTANKYKLNYYVDGDLYKTYEVVCDAAITKEAEPTKEDFEFSGWSEIPETMPAKDVDITGSFKRIAVTLDNVTYTFDGDNAVVTKDKGKIGDMIIASSVESDGKTYNVIGIADNVFKANTTITAVAMPDGVISIGEYAFNGCKNIKTIIIGSGIKSIGTRAFAGIDKLTDVTIYVENVPETDRTAFENSYVEYATLHVPYGSVDKYKAVGPWKAFKEIVAVEETEPPFSEKCIEPTIEYKNGKIFVNCGMEGAECVTTITSEDVNTHKGNEIEITATYNISSYAKAEGYNDSEVVTATLCWIEEEETGIQINEQIKARAVLIQSHEGSLWVTGTIDNVIEIFDITGKMIASGYASSGSTTMETKLRSGDIALVKIKGKTIKVVMR